MNNKEVKACNLSESGIYFAMSLNTGFPVKRFDCLSECLGFCAKDENECYPVTNNFEVIIL